MYFLEKKSVDAKSIMAVVIENNTLLTALNQGLNTEASISCPEKEKKHSERRHGITLRFVSNLSDFTNNSSIPVVLN